MPTILIVDDESENLRSLRRYLQDRKPEWEVKTAQSEDTARQVLTGESIDVVISDLVMATEQGGMEVLRVAKDKDPLLMVILITAFEKKLERYKAFELGAFDCIQKNVPGVIAAEEIVVKTQAALGFRDLAMREIETEQRLALLRRYFDPKVFDLIERSPDLLEIHSQTVTVCFWDIRGFSHLCETLKAHPTLISGFLKQYCAKAAEVIFEHGGVLDKFMGDGVMALFGALNHKADEGRQDAAAAVSAARAFRERFAILVRDWLEQWKLYTPHEIHIGLGCGIHTGEALVGNVGTDIRDQFTALGPHVNFAQRVESRADKGQILVSSSTEARIKGQFNMVDAGVIDDVKNIAGEFRLFSVT